MTQSLESRRSRLLAQPHVPFHLLQPTYLHPLNGKFSFKAWRFALVELPFKQEEDITV